MAGRSKLKVFRTAIGFHDAYVAAPSQKAAIEAWGTGKDVFARGEAEIVTEPALTAEPLANPGQIVKRLRGTAAEQIAALGTEEEPARPVAKGKAKAGPAKPAPKPRPSRAALEEAEAALAGTEARQAEALRAIADRETALERERKALEKKQRKERERLEARRQKAEAAYDEAMRRWRES